MDRAAQSIDYAVRLINRAYPSLEDKIYTSKHRALALKNTSKRHVDNCQHMF